jgi:hypothetical protein
MPYRDAFSCSEFFETLKRRTYLEPEKILMLAVLQDAITCLEKHGAFGSRGNKRLYYETRDWLVSDDNDWLFSFNNVCETVGLNAGYLRRRLVQMNERKLDLDCIRNLRKASALTSRTAVERRRVGGHSIRPVSKGHAAHAPRHG